MDIPAISPWYFELNDEDHVLDSSKEVAEAVRACLDRDQGRLSISYDDGPRPRWQRFLGLAPRYISGFAALEWADDFASLIFLDDNWSEYRALDAKEPVVPPEATRTQIAHGELLPHPASECVHKDRAFQALLEALQTGGRPGWLSYRFVE
ncbi:MULTISPECIES: hypothetical protein [unclassified Lysobacter]|uniref:hypothetical protein n=1 Tax=unclassified Lysobacter TaxID=2635362 RepID=UPI0012F72A4E|nr:MULTISPECIES: hypothetical protein [unclassified Lysobacter]